MHAVDPDVQAAATAHLDENDVKGRQAAVRDLIEEALVPLASNAPLRTRIMELRRQHDRIIDEVSTDELLEASGVARADGPDELVHSWAEFLQEHRDEIAAVQVLQEAKSHRVPFKAVQELADRIARPPHQWTTEQLWAAYEKLDGDRVKPNTHARATDLVSLLRFTLGMDDELVPFEDVVRTRYAGWLEQQRNSGVTFTDAQRWWLDSMVDVVVTSGDVKIEVALDKEPFIQRGGVDGVLRDLGNNAGELLTDLNKELTA